MKNIVAASAALLLAALPAAAADMPLKAPPALFGFETSGWYLGVDTGAAVAQTKENGGTLFAPALVSGTLTAAGGTIGACAGYVRGMPSSWFSLHGCVDYQNIAASSAVAAAPASIASRWSSVQEVRIGGNALSFFQAALSNLGVTGLTFPTFAPPSPNGSFNLAATPHQYLGFGVSEFGVQGNFGGASGATVGVAPMIEAGAIWQTLGANGQPNGGALNAYAQVTFSGKGFTVADVLAPGLPPAISGSANMGTQYKAGLAYLFAVPTSAAPLR